MEFKDKVEFIPVGMVDISGPGGEAGVAHHEYRFRRDYGDMDALVASVKEKGIIQPITVGQKVKASNGREYYPLLAGRRRLWAATSAGLAKVPALIRDISGEMDLREIELMENVMRKDFEWQEEAALIKRIDTLYREKKTDWSQRKTANLLGVGLGSVNRALTLANASIMVPEIGQAKTAADALKMIDRLEERVVVEEMVKAQGTKSLDKGIKAMLEMARRDYRIGDVFKELAKLKPNGNIHIIECDPPYGIDLGEVKRGKEEVNATVRGYNEVERGEYPEFLRKLCNELYRAAGSDSWLIFWFGPTHHGSVLSALRAAGWTVDDIPAIWVKPQGQTNAPDKYLGRSYEPFFIARKGNPYISRKGRLNTFLYTGDSDKYHPTQRPVALIKDILTTFGVDLMNVLVPFLGSGATLRAAYQCGMRGFGWDINESYRNEFLLAIEEDARNLNTEGG